MNSEQSPPQAAAYDDLPNIRQELDRCMKCGNCMAVCPIYASEKVEASVTRAKVAVAEAVLNGDLAMGRSAGLSHAFQLPRLQVVHGELPHQSQLRPHHPVAQGGAGAQERACPG